MIQSRWDWFCLRCPKFKPLQRLPQADAGLKLVGKFAGFVFRVRNQFLMAAVHHPIQIFQRKFFNAKTPRRKDAICSPEPEPGRCSWERWRLAGEFWFSASDWPAGRRRSQEIHRMLGAVSGRSPLNPNSEVETANLHPSPLILETWVGITADDMCPGCYRRKPLPSV
jgi:hypothetical protein